MSLKSLAAALALAAQAHLPHPATSQAKNSETCLKTCAVSEGGYSMIRLYEGYMPFPYADVGGIQTVGYGYVIRAGDKFTYPLLPDQADALLKTTMRKVEPQINKLVKVRLRQNQFDALGSWTYNLGSGALAGSTLLKRVNAERHDEVPEQILRWNKARVKGVSVIVPGLTTRRHAEAERYAEN